MNFSLNADELFKIGVEIEKNGRAFYDAAAKAVFDPHARKLFAELSEWEIKHVELFENLRKNLPADARGGDYFDPASETGSYIKDAADNHIFARDVDPAALGAACKTAVEALDIALTFEKDSVVFYTAMKKLIPPHLGQASIDAIIEEEIRHVAILNGEKAKLKA